LDQRASGEPTLVPHSYLTLDPGQDYGCAQRATARHLWRWQVARIVINLLFN